MGHELLHTLLETLILLPFLFICYTIIELIESWSSKKTTRSLKNSKYQVLLGSSIGLIPQCGFGVIATDLFAKKKIYMGALIAVFVSTSDEAIPVILSHPDKIGVLLPLLLSKFIFAIIVGYIVYLIERHIERKKIQSLQSQNSIESKELKIEEQTISEENHNHNHNDKEHIHENDIEKIEETIHIGCCGHSIEEEIGQEKNIKIKLKHYLLHPLLHTLYIFTFILVVNLIFSATIYSVGTDKISAFMLKAKPLTPLLAVLVGLIPNCASSVVLTNMYLLGSLPFGAMLSGLIINAGISFTVLFKQNKNFKQNLTILGICVLTALVAGYSLLWVL